MAATAETRAALADPGCPAIQGYLVARPMPAGDLLGWAAARSVPAAEPA